MPARNAIQLTRGRTGTMFTINPAAIPSGTEVDMGFGTPGSPGFPIPPRPRSNGLPREVIFGLVTEGCQPAPQHSASGMASPPPASQPRASASATG